MCYSKEVSLAAGIAISTVSYWYYIKFYIQQKLNKINSHISDFSLWFILAFLSIGGHQFAEFISIAFGSHFIYKVGLISSILCTYFMMLAFEKLSGKKVGSWIVGLVIILISIDIFTTDMIFNNEHFWVRGLSHKYWAVFWLANWVYLCAFIILLGFKAQETINKKIYWFYGFLGINVSFTLSWIYALIAHRYGSTCTLSNCSYHFLSDFIYRYDFPSLWCTFTVIQAPFFYVVLKKIQTSYKTKEEFGGWKPDWLTILKLLAITAIIMFSWYYITPIVLGVSWKMMSS